MAEDRNKRKKYKIYRFCPKHGMVNIIGLDHQNELAENATAQTKRMEDLL